MFFRPNPQMVEHFGRQFKEQADRSYIYRRYGKGAPYRITEQQWEDFHAEYSQGFRRLWIGMISYIWLALALGVVWLIALDGNETNLLFGMIAMFLPGIAGFVWLNRRLHTAPERALERETPIGAELTREEWRREALSQMSYRNLALAPFVGIFLVISMSDNFDIQAGWGRMIWLVPIGLTAFAAIQAYRKYQIEGTMEDA